MITNPRVRRWLKRRFGTVHLVREMPGGGTGHIWVLPWETNHWAWRDWERAS